MLPKLRSSKYVYEASSEEEPEIVKTNGDGQYVLCWDPLDGSSIVDSWLFRATQLYCLWLVREMAEESQGQQLGCWHDCGCVGQVNWPHRRYWPRPGHVM